MTWITEPFTAAFLLRALVGGLLVAAVCGVVGTWVVVRGMAFLGEALAHGMLPGVALATVLGLPPVLGAAVSAVVMSRGVASSRGAAGCPTTPHRSALRRDAGPRGHRHVASGRLRHRRHGDPLRRHPRHPARGPGAASPSPSSSAWASPSPSTARSSPSPSTAGSLRAGPPAATRPARCSSAS